MSKQSTVQTPEIVQFLSRAVDFTGAMVLHCHNVDHEDNGMMELVEIVK
ncbi:multicopper oxidase domain-containing protein [Oleomonas cavernae]|nr:multicopper oxidase domain-containing protein [Oleomonas cavernae]